MMNELALLKDTSVHYSQDTFNTSLIKVDTTKAIRPLKSIIEIAFTGWEIGLAILVMLILFALCTLIVIRFIKPNSVTHTEPVNALKWATAELARVQASPELKAGNIFWYYDSLNMVLREFIHMRFKIDAVYMTSEQLVRALSGFRPNSALYEQFSRFFHQTDLVKFAKHTPAHRHTLEIGQVAKELVVKLNAITELKH